MRMRRQHGMTAGEATKRCWICRGASSLQCSDGTQRPRQEQDNRRRQRTSRRPLRTASRSHPAKRSPCELRRLQRTGPDTLRLRLQPPGRRPRPPPASAAYAPAFPATLKVLASRSPCCTSLIAASQGCCLLDRFGRQWSERGHKGAPPRRAPALNRSNSQCEPRPVRRAFGRVSPAPPPVREYAGL